MKPILSFQPLTERDVSKIFLDAGCSLKIIHGYICDGDRNSMTEEQAGEILLRYAKSHGICWDAVDEWIRRMRR